MSDTSKGKFNVEVLPRATLDPRFQQRESGVAHTPYSFEVTFYTCIKNGDVDGLNGMMSHFMENALIVGRMSNDALRQAQYLAVSCITLATRYAVEGGLLESEAYNLSDGYIQAVDNMKSVEEILDFLPRKAVELTLLVRANRERLEYSPHVRKAIKFINAHLHERIRCIDVANACGVGSDYLSAQFKKSVGDGLAHYILRQKLDASKALLNGDFRYDEIGYYFGFCSQTHYIECFKKEYGITPRQFASTQRSL